MTVRLFHCHDCGHKMRFLGRRCGYCWAEKTLFQRPFLWVLLLLILLLAVNVAWIGVLLR